MTTTYRANPNIGCKFPVTIMTDTQVHLARTMSTVIFLAANRTGGQRFLPALPNNPDPNEGEAR